MPKQQIQKLINILEQKHNKKINFETILVTGTYGKTTTSHYTSIFLQKLTPLKIGLFSKPHITNINERIRINYLPIPNELFLKYKNIVQEINKIENINLNWFDELVAIAILYFIEQKINLAIFEIGIGGLNDSTNALKSIINIITSISLEHTNILGKTIKQIANQKAGIIKENSLVITNAKKGIEIIKQKCIETNSKLIELNKLVKITKKREKFPIYTFEINIKDLNIKQQVNFNSYYLVENFSIALLTAIYYCNLKNLNFVLPNLQEIADSLQIPLKMQIIQYNNKTILFDTAKDYYSISKLLKELLQKLKKFQLLIAFSKGKEIKLIKKILLKLSHQKIKTYITEHLIKEKEYPAKLILKNILNLCNPNQKKIIQKYIKTIPKINNILDFNNFIEKCKADKLVITGSLYFCSHIYNLIKEGE